MNTNARVVNIFTEVKSMFEHANIPPHIRVQRDFESYPGTLTTSCSDNDNRLLEPVRTNRLKFTIGLCGSTGKIAKATAAGSVTKSERYVKADECDQLNRDARLEINRVQMVLTVRALAANSA